MGNVTFDLVCPEGRVASLEASAVQIPGADGDMTAMAGHVPTITSLRPGLLRVTSTNGDEEYVVSGGFAEVNARSISVLAERAVHRDQMTQEIFNDFVADAKLRFKKAEEEQENLDGPVDDAARLLADMVAMGSEMGLKTVD